VDAPADLRQDRELAVDLADLGGITAGDAAERLVVGHVQQNVPLGIHQIHNAMDVLMIRHGIFLNKSISKQNLPAG
jgi:hypothetical protein